MSVVSMNNKSSVLHVSLYVSVCLCVLQVRVYVCVCVLYMYVYVCVNIHKVGCIKTTNDLISV